MKKKTKINKIDKREKTSIILFKARALNNTLAFCYFNIRYYVKKGMHPAEAGAYIAELIQKMLEQKTSGLNLKITGFFVCQSGGSLSGRIPETLRK